MTREFAELFAHEGKESAQRVDFESPAKLETMRTKLEAMQKTYQFKHVGDVVLDEEHRMYSVNFTDAQGAVRTIDWTLASAPESRQMLAQACADQGAAYGAVPDRVCGEGRKG